MIDTTKTAIQVFFSFYPQHIVHRLWVDYNVLLMSVILISEDMKSIYTIQSN